MAQRVLFLCTHNSARSQMAEALLRQLSDGRVVVASAGSEARGVHALAVAALAELGIEIRDAESKTFERYLGQPWDAVITVCDAANESCPVFPGAARRLHWSFPDPSAVAGSETERLAAFRAVRDAIAAQLRAWLAEAAPAAESRPAQ